MHENTTTTKEPLALEGRMRLALNRMIAIEEESEKGTSRISFDVKAATDERPFYACIGCTDRIYAFGTTPEAAAEEVIAKYGTPESRRAAQLEKLKLEAAKLGCAIDENPAPKPSADSHSVS
jgi:hypothetical protein